MAMKNQILQQETDGFLCLSSDESEEIDLSYWEFINPSDADDDHEIDNLSLESINDDELFVDWHSSAANSILFVDWHSSAADSIIALEKSNFGEEKSVLDDDVDVAVGVGVGLFEEPVSYVSDQYHDVVVDVDGCECYDDHDHDHVYDDSDGLDDGDGDGGYDLDDELVPRALSGKLGRQRMRKLGKRAFAKISTSKRAPFSYVKPGAVHGKHGLGMKYSC